MVRQIGLNQISHPSLRKVAEQVEGTAGVGKKDGVLTTDEVDKAIALAATKPEKFGDVAALKSLKTFLAHMGTDSTTGTARPLGGGGYSPLAALSGHITGSLQTVKDPLILADPRRDDVTTAMFEVSPELRNVEDQQSVLIPLDAKELHLIEVQYQDTRKLSDLEFNYQPKGSFEWKPFRGDKYLEMVEKEKTGELSIRREPDHNTPWINNPIKVKVDVLYPDGQTHSIGTKFLDFHVHDAYSADSSGYSETDNISNGYESLPSGQLPEGCLLRLTPQHNNRKPWEADRTIAMDLAWVKPTYIPNHKERVEVFAGAGFETVKPEGYPVDPNRKIAAVMVTWTDHGGTSSASIAIDKTEKGEAFRSNSYNIGSGETELIPIGAYARDGKVKIDGYGVDVSRMQVLYVE